MTLETIRAQSKWPHMKGKAAAIRHLAYYVKDLVGEFRRPTIEDTLIQNICTLICRFYDIISAQSQTLSAEAKEELPLLAQRLAEWYSQLAASRFSDENRLWKVQPKLHLFEHLLEVTAIIYGNPRYFWTYADEDLVGQMVDIAETVHPATLPFSVLFKWLWCYFVDLEP